MYQSISLYAVLGWCGLLAVCIALNELCRHNKWFSLLMFLGLPTILSFTVWPHTAGPGSSMNTWFYWVKTYSVMAGCLGFMAIRFVPGLAKRKWALAFPPLILAVNIAEAVLRDFQVYTFHATGQLMDNMATLSGPWNIISRRTSTCRSATGPTRTSRAGRASSARARPGTALGRSSRW